MDHRLMIAILDGFPLSWRYQAQCAFPTPTRPGLWSSGWMVANPDITPVLG
jgi:hypothetical protein